MNSAAMRMLQGHPRLLVGLAVAVAAYFVLPVGHGTGRAVSAWDIGVFVFLALMAWHIVATPAVRIEADAKRQEEGEWVVFALTLVGAIMSFLAILLFAVTTNTHQHEGASLALVTITLVLSWLTTHVTFAMRYAHEYYDRTAAGDLQRGLGFPEDDAPDYLDFIYFSFVVGMTFQVSDVEITSKQFRRLAVFQGLIGFVFNTVILALSVNIAASLL